MPLVLLVVVVATECAMAGTAVALAETAALTGGLAGGLEGALTGAVTAAAAAEMTGVLVAALAAATEVPWAAQCFQFQTAFSAHRTRLHLVHRNVEMRRPASRAF